jgi:TPR repeat protein
MKTAYRLLLALSVLFALSLGLFIPGGGSALAASLEDKPAPAVSELFWQMIDQARWGEAEAQYSVGMMYLAGQGVEKNPEEGASWIKKAADQGHAYAIFKMGELYESGIGVAKDVARSAAYYKQAAEKGIGNPDTKAYYEELRKAQMDALHTAQQQQQREQDQKYQDQVRQEQYRHDLEMQQLQFRNWPDEQWWVTR